MHFNSAELAELREEIKSLPPLEGALIYFKAKLPDLIQNQPVGSCWNYHRKTPDGYGLLNVFGKSYRLYRLSYLFFNGSLKDGEWSLHRCNNTSCWRPDHLYAGSSADNSADRVAAGATRGKLANEVVFAIKRRIAEGGTNGAIALEFGVSPSCVSHIRVGRRRRDLAA